MKTEKKKEIPESVILAIYELEKLRNSLNSQISKARAEGKCTKYLESKRVKLNERLAKLRQR
jgi:hypothetical protein